MDVLTIKEIKGRVDRLLFVLDYQLEPDQYVTSYKNIMDSLEFVEFAMACEREFKIKIPDEQLAEVVSINGLIDLVNKNRESIFNYTQMKKSLLILSCVLCSCAVSSKIHDYEPCGKVTFIDAYGFEITLVDKNHGNDALLFFQSNRPDTVKANQTFCITASRSHKRR